MTTLEERVPSCPIFFAITKLLTVVAEPSMIRMATNLSVRNPSFTAIGRKMAQRPISFIKAAMADGLIFPKAFLISKVAPIAMSPIGVATFPMLEITFLGIAGIGIFNADQTSPATIPIRIGFVTIPLTVFFTTVWSSPLCPGLNTDKTTTAIILYNGTLPMIIKGAIPAFP